MSRYISEVQRKIVAARAFFVCEYCLIHEEDSYFSYEIDHIISLKHGGETQMDNLAYSCITCNRNKGSDIASVLSDPERYIRFYHPRKDSWNDHFQLVGSVIEPLTDIGRTTLHILDFNHTDRILERQSLINIDRYLHPGAKQLIS